MHVILDVLSIIMILILGILSFTPYGGSLFILGMILPGCSLGLSYGFNVGIFKKWIY